MFDDGETVFILGAGSSWHYGYPTGEGLVGEVLNKAARLKAICDERLNTHHPDSIRLSPDFLVQAGSSGFRSAEDYMKAWGDLRVKCHEIEQRILHSSPVVIDYFIGQNPSIATVLKILISWTIFDRESISEITSANVNIYYEKQKNYTTNGTPYFKSVGAYKGQYNDDWYKFVIHKLFEGATNFDDLKENKVKFVTFNYDLSLERKIYNALISTEIFFEKIEKISEFFADGRFLHVYGAIRTEDIFGPPLLPCHLIAIPFEAPLKPMSPNQERWTAEKWHFDSFSRAAENIRAISPTEKENDKIFLKAQEALRTASRVFIVGFGFDAINVRNLNLENLTWSGNKKIYYTNFGNSRKIRESVSSGFFKKDGLIEEDGAVKQHKLVHDMNARGGYLDFIMSEKNAYGAFSHDFLL